MAAASNRCELLGVCTVQGNTPVENVTENTLCALQPAYRVCPTIFYSVALLRSAAQSESCARTALLDPPAFKWQ